MMCGRGERDAPRAESREQKTENVAVASPIVELSSYRCVQFSFVIQDLTIGEDLEKRKIRAQRRTPTPHGPPRQNKLSNLMETI